jgi:hypothetical protein
MLQRHAANIIKVAAVITAVPRWVIALLSAEGLIMPTAWHAWWIVFSALSAVGMAIVEGVAFAYVFNAWRNCKQVGQSRILVVLAGFSAVLFVALLTPSIAASVRGLTLGAWIANNALLTLWAGVVSASTISIVASIGYAERTRQSSDIPVRKATQASELATQSIFACERCDATFANRFALSAHARAHKNGHIVEAIQESNVNT